MAMNANMVKMGAIGLGGAACAVTSAALGASAIKTAGKITGKTVGLPGSMAHVLTNDKLDKQAYKKDISEIRRKDTAKTLGLAGLAAGAAAGVSKLGQVSAPVGKALANVKGGVKKFAPKLSDAASKVKGHIPAGLPKPAKAAIMAGGAVLAAALPFLFLKGNADSAYIEAKHETK